MTLGLHGGVLDCYEGVQGCEGGVWGACANGTAVQHAAAPGAHTQSLGPSSACTTNPCDPFCWNFADETPVGGVQAETDGSIYGWTAGTLASIPAGLEKKGFQEPCESASDCQFDFHCTDVATSSTCSHSKCIAGSALASSCDPCVKTICDADATCCADTTCAHDLCQAGPKLASSCDPCVDAVCAVRPSCCTGTWDSACVNLVATTCAAGTCACPPGSFSSNGQCYQALAATQSWTNARTACQAVGTGWDLVSIGDAMENAVVRSHATSTTWIGLDDRSSEGSFVWSNGDALLYTHWAASEPNGGASSDCVTLAVASGAADAAWSDESCNNKRIAVCEGPKTATGATPHAWSQACVNRVATTCGATCGASGAGTGVCAQWLPGETNPSCALADLGAAVPCGNEIIPVCNHGTKTAPAGIPIVHFAANSQQYPSSSPNLTSAARKDHGECVTTDAILPGRCVDVPCPSLTQNNEIMVNPPGLVGSVPECTRDDNWSLYNKGTACEAPTCSGASSRANLQKVNLYFIFDRSGSMGDALVGGGTKWSGSVSAMTAFFQDASSAGLGIALEFFPLGANQTINGVPTGDGCYSGSSCASVPCANPMVSLGTLSALTGASDPEEDRLVKALSGLGPSGNTPSYPAMRGALDWAVASHQADPLNQYAVVLVTDGDPTACFSGASASTTNAQIAVDAAAAYATHGIRTYAIGQEGANLGALDAIARSGGTDAAFVIGGANQAQVRADLLAALHAIAGQSASCSFALPNLGSFDPKNAKVTYTTGSGNVLDLAHQSDTSGCGTGWYYDDAVSPTTVTFCPSTCGIVQADSGAKIDVALGCPAPVKQTVYSQTYIATCPASQQPQWGYLSYDAVTPGDSALTFQVRVATTQAGLATAPWKTVAATPADPVLCGPGGPAPCPKGLYPVLGSYDAHDPYLELQIVLDPTSDLHFGPSVNSWNLSYSCLYAE